MTGAVLRTLALTAAIATASLTGVASASDPITRFGATVHAWNATHTMDRRVNVIAGCCYDPIPTRSRPGVTFADRYYVVQPIGGYVISYFEWLGNGTTATAAKAAALRELPSDARVVSFTVHGNTCAILIASSAQLLNALASVPDLRNVEAEANKLFGVHESPSVLREHLGQVVVEFGSGADESHYNPKSVNNLLFSSGTIAGSTAQNC